MKQGFREDGLLLKVGVRKNTDLRLGVVVSKKVEKLAVRRNRIRRVLREAAKGEIELMKGKRNLALIVLPGFELPSFQEVKRMLHRLLRKASLSQ